MEGDRAEPGAGLCMDHFPLPLPGEEEVCSYKRTNELHLRGTFYIIPVCMAGNQHKECVLAGGSQGHRAFCIGCGQIDSES